MGTREAKLSMPRPSVYRLEKLARQWSVLFKEPVTESDILQMALDENFCVHVHSSGIRSVMLRSREKVLARKPAIAIPAYMDEQYIKLSDHQIRALLSDNAITVSLLWLNDHEIKLIQGDASFELLDVEAVVVDERERITITPDDIKFLSVMSEDVAAFEEKLLLVGKSKIVIDRQSQSLINDLGQSGLLSLPKKRQNAWADVIDDMTKEFYKTHRYKPNEEQAWGALCKNPPPGYQITIGKSTYHHGEDVLEMPGVRALSRSAFKKRWGRYTKEADKRN